MTYQPSPHPRNNKKLVRSMNDRYIAGVCGGIAETYNIDPTLVRLVFVALFLAGMSGLLIYIICWIVIPNAELY
ncbi:PspC domain-containing protein [Corynebacterium sp. CCUG 65737]|uniref:PspC domain-containing protein n=1 Tax=Corynebacterium sp. CCUG 65737 TaxID=2823889 RepID=UPI00210DC907|nr:PspC domain-containing protein [Corynebacterium sp. CCUG 65737]MCQ4628343.1 PspC domain-containing protein [Corynebacterium sp. CCUG 65737]